MGVENLNLIFLKNNDIIYIENEKERVLEKEQKVIIMNNTFIDSLKRETNFVETENGAVAHKTTLNAVYDMFALGGAYRNRDEADCILLFKKALEEDETLALKCLFYLRDIRGGKLVA